MTSGISRFSVSAAGLVSRRRFLTLVGLGAGASLLAACGQASQPLPTSAAAPPASKPADAKPTAAAAPAAAPAATQPAPAAAAKPAAAKPADAKPAGQAAPAANLSGQTVKFGVLANYKGEALEAAMPAFTKATGINVSIDKLPQENLIDKLTVSYAAGNPVYDISMADETWVTGLAPYLAPMDDWITRDKVDMAQYVPNAASAGVVNKVRVAMPLDPNVNMLWYRKDLFDAKGVKQPANFDEIVEAAEKLNDPANNVAGISVAGSKTGGQVSALAELLLWNAGGEIVTADGKFGFDSPAGIKALQTYQRIIKSAPPGVMANGATEELDAFYQGRAAMVFYWASIGPNATDPSKSKGAASMGWAGVPNGMRGVWNMAIPKESKVKDAAWELAKWLSGPEGSLAFTNGGGGHSPRYDVLKNPDFQKKFPWAPDLLKALEGCRNRPQLTTWSAIDTAVGDMTTSVLAGQASPEDAIKSATSQVQPYLKS